ncbi:MAG: hypothetical protein IT349_12630, partial [Candidatus Eisenbacteria bacterium]|nr:hypothetical protein [Candidatus Eisenbacteria bacterium]
LLLTRAPDLRLSRDLTFWTSLVVAALGFALWAEPRITPRWSTRSVLLVAVLLRLCFLLRPPELSDDIYRYLWDAGSTFAGKNPYALAPSAEVTGDLERLALQQQVNHPELVTIYPPAAQVIFALARLAPAGLTGFKLALVLLDLCACLVAARLLRALGLPPWRLALYAWHPLAVIEIAGSGHIDGAGVLLLLLSFSALVGPSSLRSGALAGSAFAASVLTKLVPLAWAPFLLLVGGRRRVVPFLTAGLLTAVALIVPFLPEIRHGLGTLSTYTQTWEFAGLAFRTLRQLTGSGELARRLLGGGFVVIWTWVTIRALRERPVSTGPGNGQLGSALRASYRIAIAFLLLSPTLHAWYALYLAALLPFVAGPAGFVLSGSVFFGYTVLPRFAATGEWIETDSISIAVAAPAAAAFIVSAALRSFRPRRS